MRRNLLILRNLWYYRRPWLAILAGVVISTGVLTGALIVGDSVRESLRTMKTQRLGNIRFAITPGDRLFRQELAGALSVKTGTPVAPVLQTAGIAISNENNTRINRVNVLGIDARFPVFWDQTCRPPGVGCALLGRNVAEKLGVKPGDEIVLRIQTRPKAPMNAPFITDKAGFSALRLKISTIACEEGMGRFSLKSDQSDPFNIFVSLNELARCLGIPGLANSMVAGGKEGLTAGKIDTLLQSSWQLADAGLQIRSLHEPGRYEIISGRIFISDTLGEVIRRVLPESAPVLTYLVNTISSGDQRTPYSFVTAGSGDFPGIALGPKEIVINDWLAHDLSTGPGELVKLRYFVMGPAGTLREDSTRFIVKSVMGVETPPADRDLMPAFPGMSDAGNCRDWKTGAPVDLKRIRDKDEQYWKDYRGTPKAFISLATGRKMWKNRFGSITAVRFHAAPGDLRRVEEQVMQQVRPAREGLMARSVFHEGKEESGSTTDFGGLFLGLSFFIFAAALLLTLLLFSLHARERMAESGLLMAIGFTKRQVTGILLREAFTVAAAGSLLGILAGIVYNRLLIFGLNTLWQDAVRTQDLKVHFKPDTLLIGCFAGMLLSLGVMGFTVLKYLRNPGSLLVKREPGLSERKDRSALYRILTLISLVSAMVILTWLILTGQTANAPFFLAAGALILMGGIGTAGDILTRAGESHTAQPPGRILLVLRNAAMKRSRTISAIALLALGTFSIIITGANRQRYETTSPDRASGTGGFLLEGETTLPLLGDLNTIEGKNRYGLADEPLFRNVRFTSLQRLAGDDASCLNLNQVSQPTLLAIPTARFDSLRAFGFAVLDPSVNRNHPWQSLEITPGPGIILAFADQTVIQWGLHKKIGDTLVYHDESGALLQVKLMGGLENSIFQGNLLISDSLFHDHFPSVAGSNYILADAPAKLADSIASQLETLLRDQGIMVVRTAHRLAGFNAVENTYLSVFMLLGGLGVVIGTFGLGIILLRNLQERKQELALYLALGFPRKFVLKLLLGEYLFILFTGTAIGGIAALAGILPSLLSPAFELPAGFLLLILAGILINGFLWILIPAKKALKRDILKTLREE